MIVVTVDVKKLTSFTWQMLVLNCKIVRQRLLDGRTAEGKTIRDIEIEYPKDWNNHTSEGVKNAEGVQQVLVLNPTVSNRIQWYLKTSGSFNEYHI